jgi:HlyD family secretion protein
VTELTLKRERFYFRKSFWIKIGLFSVKIAILILVIAYASGDHKGDISYETAPVIRDTLSISVSALGVLQPTSRVEVGVEVSGLVRTVLVDVNDPVKDGQTLARLDIEQFKIQQEQAGANLLIAEGELSDVEASLRETSSRYDRMAQLRSQGHVAQQDLEAVKAALDKARARVVSAQGRVRLSKAAIQSEKLRIDRAAILSPIDGFVLERRVQPGQTVTSTFQTPVLFVLARDLREMYLRAEISEADIGRVAVGQKATFKVDSYPNRVFEATIWRVVNSPSGRSNLVTYEATLLVSNDDLALRPGMTASVDIVTDTLVNVVTVPNEALGFKPQGKRGETVAAPTGGKSGLVWIPVADGKPGSRRVVLGPTNGFRTAILSGLTPEEVPSVIVSAKRS